MTRCWPAAPQRVRLLPSLASSTKASASASLSALGEQVETGQAATAVSVAGESFRLTFAPVVWTAWAIGTFVCALRLGFSFRQLLGWSRAAPREEPSS